MNNFVFLDGDNCVELDLGFHDLTMSYNGKAVARRYLLSVRTPDILEIIKKALTDDIIQQLRRLRTVDTGGMSKANVEATNSRVQAMLKFLDFIEEGRLMI